jgi:hypothetical protein
MYINKINDLHAQIQNVEASVEAVKDLMVGV